MDARKILIGAAMLLTAGCASTRDAAPDPAEQKLTDTAWLLTKFVGGDGNEILPGVPDSIDVRFNEGGSLAVRLNCNRGRGQWESRARAEIVLSPLAVTRAACRDGANEEWFLKRWPFVRSYVIREGRLHLAIMADGGIFEFKPAEKPGLD
jgi:para-nitrobenzyl esterase